MRIVSLKVRNAFARLLLALGLLVLAGSEERAVSADTLFWNPNTDTNTVGYNVHFQAGITVISTNVGNTTNLVLGGFLPAGQTYSVYVTAYNAGGTQSDPSAAVSFFEPHNLPIILAQPSSLTVKPGSPVGLAVQATGSGALSYQWFKNGSLMPGFTNSSFAIPISLSSHSGAYTVEISNPAGSILSVAANVTVLSGAPVIAPVIFEQPTDLTVNEGAPGGISVQAVSGGFLQYEWWKDGRPLAGATAATLSFPATREQDGGLYFVKVSSAAGLVISQSARVTVVLLPRILEQPQTIGAAVGASAVLAVSLALPGSYEFQWFKNGEPIPGADSDRLSFTGLTEADSGSYTVRITNIAGSVLSEPAVLRAHFPPEIVSGPDDLSLARGDSGALTLQLNGTAPFQFQWYRDELPLQGETNASLPFVNAEYSDSGRYHVIIHNPAGTISSRSAALAVGGPRIISQSADALVSEGGSVTFNVTVVGEAPFHYQWFKDGIVIAGQATPSLTLNAVPFSAEGSYSVRVSNAQGSTTSLPARLTVLAPPRFTSQPASASFSEGSLAVLSAAAQGSKPLAYQWLKNGQPVASATNAVLEFASVRMADAGVYFVRVTNGVGQIESQPAILTVISVPRITTPPLSTTVKESLPVVLSVTAAGEGTLLYQWFKDGVEIPGATNDVFRIEAAEVEDAGAYTVRVSNTSGFRISAPATVTVLTFPKILSLPGNVIVSEDSPVSLSMQIESQTPPSFQWLKDGFPLAGATSRVLEIASAKPADQGAYSLRIVNAAGSATSPSFTLTVVAKPRITTHPASLTATLGSTAFLSVQASGSGSLAFQWLKNGQPMTGASIPALILPSVKITDAGAYSVRVSNEAGSIESQTAVISLLAAPEFTTQPASATITEGAALTLAAQATGAPAPAYQWLKNSQPIAGASGETYSIASASASDAGSYSVRASNSEGEALSQAAVVTVQPAVTDPEQAAGRLTATAAAGGAAILARGIPGSTYEIQACNDLLHCEWITIQTIRVGTAGTFEINPANSSVTGPNLFFRTIRK